MVVVRSALISDGLFETCYLGAFLIPYFILYFLIGAPLYYLELALGQFSSRGPATCFNLAKGWQGTILQHTMVFLTTKFFSRRYRYRDDCEYDYRDVIL